MMVQQATQTVRDQIDHDFFSNNVVAESDYQAALQAIASTFEEFQTSAIQQQQQQQEEQSESNIASGQHAVLDQQLITEIYETAKQSLMKNLERMVRPISDDDYHGYVDQYHYVLDDEDESDINERVQSEDSDNSDDDDDEEEEVNEEELVDMKAWKDARNLRSRINTMTSKVQTIRERILKHSEAAVTTKLQTYLADQPIEIKSQVEEEDDDPTIPLQESLQSLAAVLEDPQWKHLPERIEALHDTIEAIKKETADNRPLSQIELTITSNKESQSNKLLESTRELLENFTQQEDDDNEDSISAIDRLALLGQMP